MLLLLMVGVHLRPRLVRTVSRFVGIRQRTRVSRTSWGLMGSLLSVSIAVRNFILHTIVIRRVRRQKRCRRRNHPNRNRNKPNRRQRCCPLFCQALRSTQWCVRVSVRVRSTPRCQVLFRAIKHCMICCRLVPIKVQICCPLRHNPVWCVPVSFVMWTCKEARILR